MSWSNSPSPASALVVIPARYGSTRFPGKPLALIHGKPMIQHVVERAQQAQQVQRVIVATDDEQIRQCVLGFGGEAWMTSPHHTSGTDRVWEVAQQLPQYPIIVNVQGDEPFLDPTSLDRALTAMMEYTDADWVTLVTPIQTQTEWEDRNVVKAVLSRSGQALYFSRAPIPCVRDPQEAPSGFPALAYRHIGLYLFRRPALEAFTQLPPSPLEQLEKLEQLRALENGLKIYAVPVKNAPIGIDTPEDLSRIN